MRRLVREVLLGVVLLTGCGTVTVGASKTTTTVTPSTVAPSTVAPTTVTPTTVPPTTVTPTTVTSSTTQPGDYGNRYLALVAPPNCALAWLNALLDQEPEHSGDWSWYQQKLLPAEGAYATSLTTFYEGLLHATWPPEAQGDVDVVVADARQNARFYKNVASAADFTSLEAAWDAPFVDPDQQSAAALRAKLGLPPNSDDANVYCPGTVA